MSEAILNIDSGAYKELIEDLGIEDLPEKEKEEALSSLSEVVIKRLFADLMEKIGADGRVEYGSFMARNPSTEEVREFFVGKVSNIEEFAEKVIEKMRNELLHGV